MYKVNEKNNFMKSNSNSFYRITTGNSMCARKNVSKIRIFKLVTFGAFFHMYIFNKASLKRIFLRKYVCLTLFSSKNFRILEETSETCIFSHHSLLIYVFKKHKIQELRKKNQKFAKKVNQEYKI